MCWSRMLLAICLISSHAHAREMIAEINAGYAETDSPIIRSKTLSGRYFFSPIETTGGPRALAPFLQRADYADLAFLDHEERNDVTLGGLYSHDETGWFASGSISQSDGRSPGLLPAAVAGQVTMDDADGRAWGLSIGKYIFEYTTLSLSVGRSTDDTRRHTVFDFPPLGILELDSRTETTSNVQGFRVQHFGLFGRYGYEASANYTRGDVDNLVVTTVSGGSSSASRVTQKTTRYSVEAAFYPVDSLSIGMTYALADSNLETESTGFSVKWFALDWLAIAANYHKDDIKGIGLIAPLFTRAPVVVPGVTRSGRTDVGSFGTLVIDPPFPTAVSVLPGPSLERETITIGITVRF